MEQLKNKLVLFYLDWVNDFVGVDTFADYYGIERGRAEKMIRIGRKLHERIYIARHTPKQLPIPKTAN
jgi:hypothetical protein